MTARREARPILPGDAGRSIEPGGPTESTEDGRVDAPAGSPELSLRPPPEGQPVGSGRGPYPGPQARRDRRPHTVIRLRPDRRFPRRPLGARFLALPEPWKSVRTIDLAVTRTLRALETLEVDSRLPVDAGALAEAALTSVFGVNGVDVKTPDKAELALRVLSVETPRAPQDQRAESRQGAAVDDRRPLTHHRTISIALDLGIAFSEAANSAIQPVLMSRTGDPCSAKMTGIPQALSKALPSRWMAAASAVGSAASGRRICLRVDESTGPLRSRIRRGLRPPYRIDPPDRVRSRPRWASGGDR